MEYSHLLDKADECEDPYMRLVYACKDILELNISGITCKYYLVNRGILVL